MLGLQETPLYLGLGVTRDSREGSVSRTEIRRKNHVGTHRSGFDHLLVTWAFRISRIYRFIPHIAGRRHHPPDYAFRVREKGQRLKGAYFNRDSVRGMVGSLLDHFFFADSEDLHNS